MIFWGGHAPRVPLAAPRRQDRRLRKGTAKPLSNLRPFGQAPIPPWRDEGPALPREETNSRRNRRSNR